MRSIARQECFGSWTGAVRRVLAGRGTGKAEVLFLAGMTWILNQDICEMSGNYTGDGETMDNQFRSRG